MELSICDAFEPFRRQEACLGFKATMLNINLGQNEELMGKCKRLRDYAVLIGRIREYLKQGLAIEAAVDRAVNDCINEDVLADILSKNKAEVFEMILTEYNEQNHIANEKMMSYEEGIKWGIAQGLEQGIQRGTSQGKIEDILELLKEHGDIPQNLQQRIMEETNQDTLKIFLKLAARSTSIEAFMKELNSSK